MCRWREKVTEDNWLDLPIIAEANGDPTGFVPLRVTDFR
jgi:hypothetical protein